MDSMRNFAFPCGPPIGSTKATVADEESCNSIHDVSFMLIFRAEKTSFRALSADASEFCTTSRFHAA